MGESHELFVLALTGKTQRKNMKKEMVPNRFAKQSSQMLWNTGHSHRLLHKSCKTVLKVCLLFLYAFCSRLTQPNKQEANHYNPVDLVLRNPNVGALQKGKCFCSGSGSSFLKCLLWYLAASSSGIARYFCGSKKETPAITKGPPTIAKHFSGS